MIVAINQPAYLPWMGWFDRIQQADLFILLDHVQLEKGSFTNRTRIRQRDGRLMWLTIPVEKGKPINETLIADKRWKWKHRRTLDQTFGAGDSLLIWHHDLLIDVIDDTTQQLCDRMEIPTGDWLRSSRLGGTKLGAKSELVLNLCQEVDADVYLSGPMGRDYLDLLAFERAGVEVRFHEYTERPPVVSAVHDVFQCAAA